MRKKLLIVPILLSMLLCINVKAASFTPDDVDPSTYIVGTHMFTSEGNEIYDGIFTTEWIMSASRSISHDAEYEDMIIYRKQARGGWVNAISGSSITPPESFNIQFIDEVMSVDIEKPVLAESGEPAPFMKLIGINQDDYCTMNENDLVCSVDGVEYYLKNNETGEYEPIELQRETPDTLSNVLFTEIGQRRIFVARVYKMVGKTKVYSEYSDELEMYMEITKPVLSELGEPAPFIKLIGINEDDYCEMQDNDKICSVDGVEYYQKDTETGEYFPVNLRSETPDPLSGVLFEEIGQRRVFVARIYKMVGNSKVYSEYSDELEMYMEIPTPVLSIKGHPAPYIKLIGVNENDYCETDGDDKFCSVDGLEFYEKDSATGEYVQVNLHRESLDPLSNALFDIIGTRKTYYARAYKVVGGGKYYSEYSNGLEMYMTVPKPDLGISEFSCNDTTCDLDIGSGITPNSVFYQPAEGSDDEPIYYYDYIEVYEEGVDGPILTHVPTGGVRVISGIPKGSTKKYYAKAYTTYRLGFVDIKVYSEETEHKRVTAPPFLKAPSNEFWAGQDWRPLYYSVGLAASGYCADANDESCESHNYIIDGWEMYEKKFDGTLEPVNLPYESSENQGTFDTRKFDEVGVRKVFVARVYSLYGEGNSQKNYSAFSNEMVIDTTLPNLNIAYGGPMECEAGQCSIAICVTNTDSFVFMSAEEAGEENPVYYLDHYDVENVNDTSEKYLGNALTSCTTVSGAEGTSTTYSITPYITRDGNNKQYYPESVQYIIDFEE